MHSEEIMKFNNALRCCDQLKNNLQAAILHVQMLNKKYNTKDYTQLSNKFINGNLHRNISLYKSHDEPVKRNRSLQDIKHGSNNIIVKGIKLRREVETMVTQIKLLHRSNQIDHVNMISRRKHLMNCTNKSSLIDSPRRCNHRRCFQTSSDVFHYRNHYRSTVQSAKKINYSNSARNGIQETPKMRKEQSHSVMNKITPNFAVNDISFQSTPIKVSNQARVVNKSCFLRHSIVHKEKTNSTSKSSQTDKNLGNTSNSFKNEEHLLDTTKHIYCTPIVNVKSYYLPMTC